jgi:tripartite-type tricarboxylate transporter receptor subunit TctC
VHVPFNGANLAVSATLAGHTPICFIIPTPAVPLVREGKLRALAGTGKTRLQLLPDVPTMAEAGYPDIEGENWYGLAVPSGTPRQIITMLNRETVKIVNLPDTKARIATIGFETVGSTPAEFAQLIKVELDRWRKVIRTANIKPE